MRVIPVLVYQRGGRIEPIDQSQSRTKSRYSIWTNEDWVLSQLGSGLVLAGTNGHCGHRQHWHGAWDWPLEQSWDCLSWCGNADYSLGELLLTWITHHLSMSQSSSTIKTIFNPSDNTFRKLLIIYLKVLFCQHNKIWRRTMQCGWYNTLDFSVCLLKGRVKK